jgi:hypothetical protein
MAPRQGATGPPKQFFCGIRTRMNLKTTNVEASRQIPSRCTSASKNRSAMVGFVERTRFGG